jgi:hypothetical protein
MTRIALVGLALGVGRFLLSSTCYIPREVSRQYQCRNNLKAIGLALYNYADAHGGTLPPAYVADAHGRPLYSWRVLILPYIEQRPLYDRFHLDEPWDSPNNRTLIASMPFTYFYCNRFHEMPVGAGLAAAHRQVLTSIDSAIT